MKNLFPVIFIYFALIVSCNKGNKWSEYSEPTFLGNSDKAYLELTDSAIIEVPAKHFNSFQNCQIYHDSLLYAFSLDDRLRLSIYNIASKSFMYDIVLDKNTSGVMCISNFNVISEDSIFFSTSPKTGLVLVNSKGKKLDMWTDRDMVISQEMESKLSDGYAFSIASYLENFQYDKQKHLIYAVLSPFSAYDEFGEPDIKRHGIYDLSTRNWKTIMAPYEGVLKYKGNNIYFYDMHHPYQIVLGNLMYVTYPVDHRVYIYNTENEELIREKGISPSCATKFDRPMDPLVATDKELNQLRKNTAYYGPLYYHPDARCFSRFYNLKNTTGKEGERAIIIYDMDFNIVYENTFKFNEIPRIVPTDDGLVIIRTDPMNPDTFVLIRYKILWK